MNRFNEIRHKPLQVYNRCVMAYNLKEDSGQAALEDYIDSFSDKEKEEMSVMLAFVKKYGAEKTKRMVTAGLEFSDDDYVGPEVV